MITPLSFSSLSQKIRTWLASDTVTFMIISINKRLGLKNDKQKAIALLINRLATKDIAPQSFILELIKNLDIGFASAQSLAEEIKDKILKPVERQLREDLGIDVNLVMVAEEAPATIISPKPPPPASKLPAIVETPNLPPVRHALPPSPPPTKPQITPPPLPPSTPITGDQPFIIYKERPELRETPAPPPPPAPKKPEPPKPPQAKVPVRIPTTTQTVPKPAPPPPVVTRVEPPKPGEVRMVHYSNFRTPLT